MFGELASGFGVSKRANPGKVSNNTLGALNGSAFSASSPTKPQAFHFRESRPKRSIRYVESMASIGS